MRKSLKIAFILLIIHIPFSCKDNEISCSFPKTESLISKFSLEIGSIINNEFLTVESHSFDSAAILIEVSEIELSREISAESSSFSLFSRSYACNPPVPTPSQLIEDIVITSDNSIFIYNTEYNPGSDLSEVFHVANYGIGDIGIDTFIEIQNNDLWVFGKEGSQLIFQLNAQPDSTISNTMTIHFHFSKGNSLSVTSDIFYVRK